MHYKIYIQSVDNFPISDLALSAYLGFKEKGMEIILFEEIEEVPVSPWHVVVGSIEDTISYFIKLGLTPKKSLNIPEELQKFVGRKIEYMTMGEFKMDSREPIFIKPN